MEDKIFLDTNCLVDVFEDRPNIQYTGRILREISPRFIYISALTIPNINYICKPPLDKLTGILLQFNVVDLTEEIIRRAANLSGMKDYEDAVQIVSAGIDCNVFLTWNIKDFSGYKGEVEILTPKDYLAGL